MPYKKRFETMLQIEHLEQELFWIERNEIEKKTRYSNVEKLKVTMSRLGELTLLEAQLQISANFFVDYNAY
jgi:hypothetical protein